MEKKPKELLTARRITRFKASEDAMIERALELEGLSYSTWSRRVLVNVAREIVAQDLTRERKARR